MIYFVSSSKRIVVSYQRIFANFFQVHRLDPQQRMIGRNDQHMLPLVTRHRDQTINTGNGFCGNGNIRLIPLHHFGNLARISLQQGQSHLRILQHKSLHNGRQRVTSLSVSGGYRQAAAVLRCKFQADLL